MGKPTYDEVTKAFWKAEEDRQDLILENEELKDRINTAIQFIEQRKLQPKLRTMEGYTLQERKLLDILGGK